MNTNENGAQAAQPHTHDVTAHRVARVYAEALLDAAEKHGAAAEILEELEALVQDVCARDPQFDEFLASYAIGRELKTEVLRKVFASRAQPLFFNFLMVLNQHERLELLRPVLGAYRTLYDQRSRRVRVRVRSAVPLAEDQRQYLLQELHEVFRLEPVLEEQVAPELLGGLTVRVGDWLYDASVSTQLETLRDQLIERSNHEIQSGRNRFSDNAGD